MKEEFFVLDENAYLDTDYLDPKALENITGDNIFLAFLNESGQVTLSCVSAIDGRIYNFNKHKYINEDVTILFAKPFSDIMPSNIWELVYIINYDLISIEVDDSKVYIIEEFERRYQGKIDKNAKNQIIKNSYVTPKFKEASALLDKNLSSIKPSNIFVAILESLSDKNIGDDPFMDHTMEITYEGIDLLAKILESRVAINAIKLPEGHTLESWLEEFKIDATNELDEYWNQVYGNGINVNFIASINGHIYNFSTNEFLKNNIKICFAKPVNEVISESSWSLSYDSSGKFVCICVDENAIDALVSFEIEYSDVTDIQAKSRVLKNGYQIKRTN